MNRLFKTLRLSTYEVSANLSLPDKDLLCNDVLSIMTPAVAENLPDYFQGIDTRRDAFIWFERMLSESRLLVVKLDHTDQVIGFLFVYSDNSDAHIGYLLGEPFWGVGYAKELLSGFIQWCYQERYWKRLIGGVDAANIASSQLLKGLGFREKLPTSEDTVIYLYDLK